MRLLNQSIGLIGPWRPVRFTLISSFQEDADSSCSDVAALHASISMEMDLVRKNAIRVPGICVVGLLSYDSRFQASWRVIKLFPGSTA